MTPLNAAYSLNHKKLIRGTYPNISIDYSEFIWSVGTLPTLTGFRLK
ncbi:DUF6266 family protein [Pedobacter immunditicola]